MISVEEEKYPRQKESWIHYANVLWILTSVRVSILWKMKRRVRIETRDRFLIVRMMNDNLKVGERQYSKKRKKSEDSCDYCDKYITIDIDVIRFRCTRFSSNEGVSNKSIQEVLNVIQRVRFTKSTLRNMRTWDKKGPSFWKMQLKSRYQRSLSSLQNSRIDPMKKLRDKNDVSKVRKRFCHKTFQVQSDRRRYCRKSGTSMHIVSEKDLNYVELEIMRTSKSPTTIMTIDDERQTSKEMTI